MPSSKSVETSFHRQRSWFSLKLPLLLLLGLGPALVCLRAAANPAASPAELAPATTCSAPRPGRYAVMGEGDLKGEPLARLLLETWNRDGSLRGVRLERRGKLYRESSYTGSFRPLTNCRVAIERTYGNTVSSSQAVLDPQGRPRFSLGILPDVLMVSRWFVQPELSCSASLLDGVVVSQQRGKDWRAQQWQPNAVVQREQWRGGQVKGLAVSSYGATVEEATYSGSIEVQSDCLATIKQRDSLGADYNYRAIVLADGSGYLYLQTDQNDVAVAFLQRLTVDAPAAP
ncbi:MAG: hypothetical protein RLZZ609_3084 [Cyanobacteriota bacterium]|jgi:hypothetical protein